MTNESKVVAWADPLDLSEVRDDFMACSDRYATSSCLKLRYTVPLVTHADYRALEERMSAYRNLTVEVSVLQDQFSRYADADCRDCDGHGVYYGNVCVCHCVTAKLEELAALRGKVGELVEADRAFDAAQMSFVMPKAGITCDEAADNCEKAIERRRKALERLA